MKQFYTVIFFCFFLLSFSQQKQINIEWEDAKVLENDFGKMRVPGFSSKHFSYSTEKGLVYFAQWSNNAKRINEKSVNLSNISYQTITKNDLFDLNEELIPEEPVFNIFNTNARGKKSTYFEISPIVKQNGVIKKITSLTINYNTTNTQTSGLAKDGNDITNSVLANGEWYRFYID